MPIKYYIDHGNGKVEDVEKDAFDANLRKAQEKRGLVPTVQKPEPKKATEK